MTKLARAKAVGKVTRGHSIKRKGLSIEVKNEFLSKQIAELMFKDTSQIKPLIIKDGVVTNLDYNNPNHMRWLED